MENKNINHQLLYKENKNYFDKHYVPQQNEVHGNMLTIENLISDFPNYRNTGVLATKYRVDQHEYGITHEWFHWVKPLKNLLSSILFDNIKTLVGSVVIFYILGKLFLNNGLISVYAYLIFFLLNNVAFLATNTRRIFSYHLSKLFLFLTNKYPAYNSLDDKKLIPTSKINDKILQSHLIQKVIPFFLLSVFTGFMFMFFINFICSINFTYSFGNFIWLFAILFPFANFHQLSIIFWSGFFQSFFSKTIYKI